MEIINHLDKCSKDLKKSITGLKRKPREVIDPFWEEWLKDRNEYLELFKYSRIKGLMKEA